MTIVIDSSIAVSWVLVDERTQANMAVLTLVTDKGAVAPQHWPLELANSLSQAIRRRRTTAAIRDEALADLQRMEIEIDGETASHAWQATLKLADHYALTIYDAAYLELAQRRRLPLATLDQALAAAATKASVELVI